MAYPVITHETELDELINELLQAIPSYENDSDEESSNDDPMDLFPQASEIASSYIFDQDGMNIHCTIYVSEGNTYDPSHEEAFLDFEKSCEEDEEQEVYEVHDVHDAMFEDAYDFLNGHDDIQVDPEYEQPLEIVILTDVNPSEEGCNEVSANESPLDSNHPYNDDTISQIEEIVFELGDIIRYLHYLTTEGSLMDTE